MGYRQADETQPPDGDESFRGALMPKTISFKARKAAPRPDPPGRWRSVLLSGGQPMTHRLAPLQHRNRPGLVDPLAYYLGNT